MVALQPVRVSADSSGREILYDTILALSPSLPSVTKLLESSRILLFKLVGFWSVGRISGG